MAVSVGLRHAGGDTFELEPPGSCPIEADQRRQPAVLLEEQPDQSRHHPCFRHRRFQRRTSLRSRRCLMKVGLGQKSEETKVHNGLENYHHLGRCWMTRVDGEHVSRVVHAGGVGGMVKCSLVS